MINRLTFQILIGLAVTFVAAIAPLPCDAAQLFIDPQFGVDVTNNIVYGSGEVGFGTPGGVTTTDLLLDLYTPSGAGVPDSMPGLVLIHGGSFTSGNKSNMAALATDFASRGYVVTSINYRLVGDNPPPPAVPPPPGIDPALYNAVVAAITDAAIAVGWLRGAAPVLGIDPDRIAIGGSSAGAATSLFLGYSEIPGAEVSAILNISGGLFGFESLIDSGDPPTFIAHGTGDSVVVYEEATDLAAALTTAGVNFEFPVLDSSIHGQGVLDLVDGGTTVREQAVQFFFDEMQLAQLSAVPEPSTGILLLTGLLSVAAVRRQKSKTDLTC